MRHQRTQVSCSGSKRRWSSNGSIKQGQLLCPTDKDGSQADSLGRDWMRSAVFALAFAAQVWP